MITQVMVQPSFWVESGITIKKVRNAYLFKLHDVQSRLDDLSERRSPIRFCKEEAELAGILELDRFLPCSTPGLLSHIQQ